MDEWLDTQGLYRKNTALDGTCLFRAVAEQIFKYHAPTGHLVLRQQCVEFMRENADLFKEKVLSGPFDDYLDNLSDSKQWAGQLELEALSLIHEVDFLLFKSIDLEPVSATSNGFERKLMLCFTPDNFYDAVFPKMYIENSGFCQSIVYSILYRGVYKLNDLEYAVEKMLHDKTARAQREKYLNSQTQFREDSCFDFYLEDTEGNINMRELLDMGAILFPYKVAKALDPDIYRNIDFDNWVDTLRVPRRNSFWFGNGGPLRVGVKCLLKLDDKCYHAHVQDMSPEGGPVLVFVEELGQKMTVSFDSLDPMPRTSLKPEWTFSHKHQIINKLNASRDSGASTRNKSVGKTGTKNKKPRGNLQLMKFDGMSMRSDDCMTPSDASLSPEYRYEGKQGGSCVTVAEPDSTTSTPSTPPMGPQAYYGGPITPTVVMNPCSWQSRPVQATQPQVVKTLNVMVTKSVKADFSDLPLADLETVRFFFNLGIDYFRMGYLVYSSAPPPPPPPPPTLLQTPSVDHKAVAECHSPVMYPTRSNDEATSKNKSYKNQSKPPRFMKLEQVEGRHSDKRHDRHLTQVDEVTSSVVAADNSMVPVVVPPPMCSYTPYTPMVPCVASEPPRAVYHGYTEVPVAIPMQESVSYTTDHMPHYMESAAPVCEPAYSVPYAVYTHPHYYYHQN